MTFYRFTLVYISEKNTRAKAKVEVKAKKTANIGMKAEMPLVLIKTLLPSLSWPTGKGL